jgi:hypothetical protein
MNVLEKGLHIHIFTDITSTDNFTHQSPFPSLNLSSRRSNLSRALSPEHTDESV